jgi:hypothetical protein
MKISKSTAQEIATQLLKKRVEKNDSKKEKLKLYVEEILVSRIPKEIDAVMKKHTDWVKAEHTFYLNGEGISNWKMRSIHITKLIATDNQQIHLTSAESEKYVKLFNEIETEEKSIHSAEEQLTNAIYAIGTVKKLETDFPEAFEVLPKKEHQSNLPVNISELRRLIK